MPNEVIDVADVFLMGLCSQQRFEQPSSIRDLPNVTNLCQGRDAMSHDDGFSFTVKDFLDGDGACCTGVDDAFVIFHRDEDAPVIKHRPELANEIVYFTLLVGGEMCEVHLRTHNCIVLTVDEGMVEARVDGTVEVWHRVT